jgi:acyl-CoA thioester hydrolase
MPVFATDLEVGAADIDDLGHVGNIVYVRWVLDAAAAHSAAVGWSLPAYRRVGGVFVVRRQEIDYLRPAFLGDRVRVETWVEALSRVTSLRRTRIVRGAEELARASTTWAFVSLEGRPIRIPEAVATAFRPAPT